MAARGRSHRLAGEEPSPVMDLDVVERANRVSGRGHHSSRGDRVSSDDVISDAVVHPPHISISIPDNHAAESDVKGAEVESDLKAESDLADNSVIRKATDNFHRNMSTVLNYFSHLTKAIVELEFKIMPKNIQLNAFDSWKLQLEIQANGNHTLASIIFKTPTISWTEFIMEHSVVLESITIPENILGKYYIQIHTLAFTKLFNTIKDISVNAILQELESSSMISIDGHPNLKRNANALWKLVVQRFKPKSQFVITQLLTEFGQLQYKINTDPMNFINTALEINAKLGDVGRGYGFDDRQLAMQLYIINYQLK